MVVCDCVGLLSLNEPGITLAWRVNGIEPGFARMIAGYLFHCSIMAHLKI